MDHESEPLDLNTHSDQRRAEDCDKFEWRIVAARFMDEGLNVTNRGVGMAHLESA